MRTRVLPLVLLATSAFAQTSAPPAATEKRGSISGTARREGSETPLSGVIVSVATHSRFANGTIYMSIANSKRIETVTDEQGRYRLADLPPGDYRVFARTSERRGSQHTSRTVKVRAGEDLTSIDLLYPATGTLSGRVLDHAKEPIRGAIVSLIFREYSGGGIKYFIRALVPTNSAGEYTFPNVEASVPYLLMATIGEPLRKGSNEPTDPDLRKPILVATFFPNATRAGSAAPVVLRSGERREGMDIVLRRAPSFCIAGTVEASGQGNASVLISGGEISSDGGNISSTAPFFRADPDGKFHACGLPAGDYRLMAMFYKFDDRNDPAKIGWGSVTITKEDVTGLHLSALPGVRVTGRVEWDGPAPEQAPSMRVVVSLRSLGRIGVQGEAADALVSIPGEFVLPNVLMGDYIALAGINSTSLYVKGLYYGATSVLSDPIQITGGPHELRVVLARDGSTIAARVADKDGKPVPDIKVVILPAAVPTEASLPDVWAMGETDQDGNYSYGPLRPGKYFVFATAARVDRSVESVAKVWNLRSRLEVVELGPNAQVQLNLAPVAIE